MPPRAAPLSDVRLQLCLHRGGEALGSPAFPPQRLLLAVSGVGPAYGPSSGPPAKLPDFSWPRRIPAHGMRVLLNIIWLLLAGIWTAIGYAVAAKADLIADRLGT